MKMGSELKEPNTERPPPDPSIYCAGCRCADRRHSKLLVYKRGLSVKFCPKCDRSFDAKTSQQVENLGWAKTAPGVFRRRV